jgi:formylglycine-generating enzyme required for sulfatase activity
MMVRACWEGRLRSIIRLLLLVCCAVAFHNRPAEAEKPVALPVQPGSGESFRDRLADGQPCPDCPEMVVVPAGKFMMGSPPGEVGGTDDERPQRKVTIARPFAVGKYEVTFGEWDACVAAGGCRHNPHDGSYGSTGWGRGKRPVINVSWDDITQEYLPWLSKKTGKTYRLLSEAEWEYAARAGTTTPFWWGSSISTSQANYYGQAAYGDGPKGEIRQKTVPVDSFAANPWGLYNVHGNVWEWVQDCWNPSYSGAPSDGSAWTTGYRDCRDRVLRGGSWTSVPHGLRSASRRGYIPGGWGSLDGFRVGRTL